MKQIKETYAVRCPKCHTLFEVKRSEFAYGRRGKMYFICPICKELKNPEYFSATRKY